MQNKYDNMDYIIYDSIPEIKASNDYDKKLIQKLNISKIEKKHSSSMLALIPDISGIKKIAMSFILSGIFLFLLSKPSVQYYAANFNFKVKCVEAQMQHVNYNNINLIKQIKKYFGE